MKLQNKIIILSIFFLPFISNAGIVITCLNTNDTSAGYPANTDCLQYETTSTKVDIIISEDRKKIYFIGGGIRYTSIYGIDNENPWNYIINTEEIHPIFNQETLNLDDGNYVISGYTADYDTYNPQFSPFIIKNGLFYKDINDIPVTTSSGIKTGNIEFGLAIVITLMCLGFVGFIYNRTSKKRPWA
jgi:hypothetical protein